MNSRFGTLLPVGLLLASAIAAQQHIHDLAIIDTGSNILGSQPTCVTNMGDLDNDGFDDLVAGASSTYANVHGDGSVFVISGKTHKTILRIDGTVPWGGFGTCVVNLGDVDKDGVPDFGVGAPTSPRFNNTSGPGVVYVYSGKTFKVLHTLQPIKSGTSGAFGITMAGLGDVDADGHADFAVGAPTENNSGKGYVYSGKLGTILRKLSPPVNAGAYAQAIVALPDMDNDSVKDLALLALSARLSSVQVSGPVWILSGRTGSVIRLVAPPFGLPNPEKTLRVVPDVDGDKLPDLGLSFSRISSGGSYQGEIHIYSSVSKKLLSRCVAPTLSTTANFGFGFDAIADTDGDGSPEIVVGESLYGTGMPSRGAIHLYSAKTGKLKTTFASRLQTQRGVTLGRQVASLGDLNRDGNPDFYAWVTSNLSPVSGLCILSGNPIDMSSDTKSIGIFKGGKAVLSIHAGPTHAKDLCMIIGSASGSYPGLMIGGRKLHLNMDSYLSFTLGAPHAVFFNNQSFLDTQGRGQVGFSLPLGLHPSIAGARLHHSCLLIGKGGLDFANISLPLDITLF